LVAELELDQEHRRTSLSANCRPTVVVRFIVCRYGHQAMLKQHESRPSIIVCASNKGGSGKTTMAVNLAAEHLRRKRRVLVVDADPQGTARWWWGIGAERGRTLPEVVAMDLQDGGQLERAAAAFDTVIVDCPSRGGSVVRAALTVADLVLVPCGTGPLDAAPLRDTLDLIDSARALRPTLAARVVITRRLDEDPLFSVEMAERLALLDDRILILEPGRAGAVPLLGVELADREAYRVALVEGQGVTHLLRDADAVREIRAFTDAVDALLLEIVIAATGTN
jgi:chromosome partitioning protein